MNVLRAPTTISWFASGRRRGERGKGSIPCIRNLALAQTPATIDRHDLARDGAGRIGKQENSSCVTIIRSSDSSPIQRLLCPDKFKDPFVTRGTTHHRRFNKGRRNDVESDVVAGITCHDRLRKSDDAGLGGRINVRRKKGR